MTCKLVWIQQIVCCSGASIGTEAQAYWYKCKQQQWRTYWRSNLHDTFLCVHSWALLGIPVRLGKVMRHGSGQAKSLKFLSCCSCQDPSNDLPYLRPLPPNLPPKSPSISHNSTSVFCFAQSHKHQARLAGLQGIEAFLKHVILNRKAMSRPLGTSSKLTLSLRKHAAAKISADEPNCDLAIGDEPTCGPTCEPTCGFDKTTYGANEKGLLPPVTVKSHTPASSPTPHNLRPNTTVIGCTTFVCVSDVCCTDT